MAGETRFHRRVLAKAILQRAEFAKKQAICALLPSNQADVNYVLYIGRGDQGEDHATYRAKRAKELQLRCVAAKAAHPDKRFIVGIAMDARGVKGSSEDSYAGTQRTGPQRRFKKPRKCEMSLGGLKEAMPFCPQNVKMNTPAVDEPSMFRSWPRSFPALRLPSH